MNIPPLGSYSFHIDAYLTDFRGKATLPMITNFMLQAATKHAEERGFGYSSMQSFQRTWVLSRMVTELYQYPENDSDLIISTWVADVNRLFTERYFAFEKPDGKKIGYARSLWAAIDLETRKPSNMTEFQELLAMVTDRECPIDSMGRISPLKDNYEVVDTFTVKYSDIDINKHLNSMKYIEHMVNVFDIDLFKEKEIRRIEINYLTEGKYGSLLNILQRKEQDSNYLLEMKTNETTLCTCRVLWK